MRPKDLAQLLAKGRGLESDLDGLEERELEVFSILSQGYSAGQIESEFGIERAALAQIKRPIQKKLKLRSELELLRYTARHQAGR